MDEELAYAVKQARSERQRDGRPGLSETADRLHKAMALLGEQVGELETTLRPILREDAPKPARLMEDPGTREGQSEVHGIVRQWLDQVESMTDHLRGLRHRVDL